MMKQIARTQADGDIKIFVGNGSRLVDKRIKGHWVTMRAEPDNGLPNGVFHLSEAVQASKNVHPKIYTGKILHADRDNVYQLAGGGAVVMHSRRIFEKEPIIGRDYELAYSRGVGRVKSALAAADAQKIGQRRARSH